MTSAPNRSQPITETARDLVAREAMAKRLFEASLYGDDEDDATSWENLSDLVDAPSGTNEYTAELKAAHEYWFMLANVALAASGDVRAAVIEECIRAVAGVMNMDPVQAGGPVFDALRALSQSPATDAAGGES